MASCSCVRSAESSSRSRRSSRSTSTLARSSLFARAQERPSSAPCLPRRLRPRSRPSSPRLHRSAAHPRHSASDSVAARPTRMRRRGSPACALSRPPRRTGPTASRPTCSGGSSTIRARARQKPAGAAAALDVNATSEERRRLREVAARMASPRVRVAIERVAARRSVPAEGSASEPFSETALGTTHDDDELTAAMARIHQTRDLIRDVTARVRRVPETSPSSGKWRRRGLR